MALHVPGGGGALRALFLVVQLSSLLCTCVSCDVADAAVLGYATFSTRRSVEP